MKRILLPHQFYYPHMDSFKNRANKSLTESFFKSLDEESESNNAMIYVHIPFCDSKCAFCGFDKAYNLTKIQQYVSSIEKEIQFYSGKKYIKKLNITGVHIGGGTPTIIEPSLFGHLIDTIRKYFNLDDVMFNIEGSATTLKNDGILDVIQEKKISRVSVGVQTFFPPLRNEYQTKATIENVYETLDKLKKRDIVTYIDIMYGFPDFNIGKVKDIVLSDLKTANELDLDGIDFGQVYPFHNPLEKRITEENLQFSTSDEVIDIIREATDFLESNSYKQVTEYAFIKKGDIIIEKSYFGSDEGIADCIAIGSGAFGYINGTKYRNSSYELYLSDALTGYSQIKQLTQPEKERTPIIGFPKVLSLNKKFINASELIQKEYTPKFNQLLKENLIEEKGDYFVLTREGKYFISNIYYFLLDDEERKKIDKQIKILQLQ